MAEQRPLVSIASESLSADIDPHGAQLFTLKDAEGRDLQWNGDPAVWAGRAPILFPIVGMLADGQYRLGGRTYHLGKHGFARHKRFDVLNTSSASAVFRLRADATTLDSYPFHFELDIEFAILEATLTVKAAIKNLQPIVMPASFGFHPAFRWPLPYGSTRADHVIRFAEGEPDPIRRMDQNSLLKPTPEPTPVVGRELALRDTLFEADAIIFDKLNSQRLSYGAKDGPSIELHFPDTPYLGVWTKPGADFIAIEPWHGINDPEGFDGDLREKPGIFWVKPGEAKNLSMTITLKP